MNNSNFHSQAFNFTSAVQGSVDPRTGLFMINMPLIALTANALNGPEFNFSLNYNPLSQTNQGLGAGVSGGLTQLDRKNNMLTLSSGEQYRLEPGSVVVRHQKMDNFRLSFANNVYQVTHKDGHVECLTKQGNDLWLPTSIFNPFGHSIALEWNASSGTPRLYRVTDDSQVELCTLKYTSSGAEIKVLTGTSAAYTIKLELTAGLLSRVITYCGDEQLVWMLGSDWIDPQRAQLKGMTSIKSPAGLTEQVTYDRITGMAFPVVAGNMAALPRVVEHRRQPGSGQPDLVSSWAYSAHNYLGWGSNLQSWAPDRDAMLGTLNDYTYSSTETGMNADGSKRVTERTWNNYHLQTKESVKQGDCIHVTDTVYHAVPYVDFSKQPVNCLQPKSVTQHWYKGASHREETTYSEFDAQHGNPLKEVKPDGTVTEYTWYPAAGAGNDCPADPYGFTRHMRTTTVTPKKVYGDEPVIHTEYRYDKIMPLAWRGENRVTPFSTTVVKKSITHKVNNKLRLTEEFDYLTQDVISMGRIGCSREIRHGNAGQRWVTEKSQNFAISTENGRLAVNGRRLVITTISKILNEDGKTALFTANSSSQLCAYTGRKLYETDAANNSVEYHYDVLGRLLSQTHHPDNADYRATQSWHYIMPNNASKTSAQTVHEDLRGNKLRTDYDGLGREVAQYIIDRDHGKTAWQLIVKNEYGPRGELKRTSNRDIMHPDTANEQVIEGWQAMQYDNWGQPYAMTSHEGVTRFSQVDPIALTATTWETATDGKQLSGWQRVYHDEAHRPIKATRFTAANKQYSYTTQQWDGAGRLRTATDELGHITKYSYDDEGRVISTELPDGSVIRKGYAAFSAEEWPVYISLTEKGGKEKVQGTQVFDRLGRIKETTNGGRTTHFTWEHAWQRQPTTMTGPDGITQHFTIDAKLGEVVTEVRAGAGGSALEQSFIYDRPTGMLSSASAQGSKQIWEPHPSGRMKSETTTINNGSAMVSGWQYSLVGVPQQEMSIDNTLRTWQYGTTGQKAGQLQQIMEGQVSVSLNYDKLQRLESWISQEAGDKHQLTTTITLDDFGRETQRVMTHSNGEGRKLVQTWYENNQLKSRVRYRMAGSNVLALLCEETYVYDDRNRLVIYTAAGEELPRDAYGNAMTGQTYRYDGFSNIIECETQLKDGSRNNTVYFFNNPQDLCQLTSLTHSLSGKNYRYPASITLEYDDAGRMIKDEAGRLLTYDAMGRLAKVTASSGSGRYGYDARNRLAWQIVDKTQQLHRLYYRGSQLINEWMTPEGQKQDVARDKRVSLIYAAGTSVAAINRDGNSTVVTQLTGTDAKQSVLTVHTGDKTQDYSYTPYGDRVVEGGA